MLIIIGNLWGTTLSMEMVPELGYLLSAFLATAIANASMLHVFSLVANYDSNPTF